LRRSRRRRVTRFGLRAWAFGWTPPQPVSSPKSATRGRPQSARRPVGTPLKSATHPRAHYGTEPPATQNRTSSPPAIVTPTDARTAQKEFFLDHLASVPNKRASRTRPTRSTLTGRGDLARQVPDRERLSRRAHMDVSLPRHVPGRTVCRRVDFVAVSADPRARWSTTRRARGAGPVQVRRGPVVEVCLDGVPESVLGLREGYVRQPFASCPSFQQFRQRAGDYRRGMDLSCALVQVGIDGCAHRPTATGAGLEIGQ
jgi:hypothetical protein